MSRRWGCPRLNSLRFAVADDGAAFDAVSANRGGAGLQKMADRTGVLGGEPRIESTHGAGATVADSVPTFVSA